MSIVLQTPPNWKVVALSLGTLIFFVLGGIVEVITYAPMLGTSGTYLGFITKTNSLTKFIYLPSYIRI